MPYCFVLEYAIDETEGYGILIEKENIRFFQLKEVSQLQEDIMSLKQYLNSPILLKKDLNAYQQLAFSVFTTLFPAEIFDQITLSQKVLTIVPDHNLQNLPFEVLATKKDSMMLI